MKLKLIVIFFSVFISIVVVLTRCAYLATSPSEKDSSEPRTGCTYDGKPGIYMGGFVYPYDGSPPTLGF